MKDTNGNDTGAKVTITYVDDDSTGNDANASADPGDADASTDPSDADASADPGSADASADPSDADANASSDPGTPGANADPNSNADASAGTDGGDSSGNSDRPSGDLPRTGMDAFVGVASIAGALLIVLGAAAVLVARRSRNRFGQ